MDTGVRKCEGEGPNKAPEPNDPVYGGKSRRKRHPALPIGRRGLYERTDLNVVLVALPASAFVQRSGAEGEIRPQARPLLRPDSQYGPFDLAGVCLIGREGRLSPRVIALYHVRYQTDCDGFSGTRRH